jgi:uncharacterized protein YxeA
VILMKRALVIVIPVVLVLALAGIYYSRASHAPDGQPPLVDINDEQLAALKAAFNRAAGNHRIILLLSPT